MTPVLQDQPDIIQRKTFDNQIYYVLDFPENYRYFNGHFPELKILPAVAQVAWVVHAISEELQRTIWIKEIRRMKFKKPIFPKQRVTASIEYQAEKSIVLFSFHRYHRANLEPQSGDLCSTGQFWVGLYHE